MVSTMQPAAVAAAPLDMIDDLDLGDVRRLLERDGMSAAEADVCVADYRDFLKKVRDEQYKGAPGRRADKAWHTHILMTRKYHEDCARILGRYLHHNPRLVAGAYCDCDDGDCGGCDV